MVAELSHFFDLLVDALKLIEMFLVLVEILGEALKRLHEFARALVGSNDGEANVLLTGARVRGLLQR